MENPDSEAMSAGNSDGNDRLEFDTEFSRELSPDIFPASKVRWDPHIIEFEFDPEYFDDESEAEDEQDIAASGSEDAGVTDDSEDENASIGGEDNSNVANDNINTPQLNFDIKVRYQNGGYFQVIALMPGGKNLGYCYTFDKRNNRFVCGYCKSLNHSTIFSLNNAIAGSPAFDIDKGHVCHPINFDMKQLFGQDKFRIVDKQLVFELGNDQSIKYRFRKPSNSFVCIDCEASEIQNEAVLYHDEDGNLFAECDLLHVCQANPDENGTVERQNSVAGNVANMLIQEPSYYDHDFDNGSSVDDMDLSESNAFDANSFLGCETEDGNDSGDEDNTQQSGESQMMDSVEHGDRDSFVENEQAGSVAVSFSEAVEVEEDGREDDGDSKDRKRVNESTKVLRKRPGISYASEDVEEIVPKKSKSNKPKGQRSPNALPHQHESVVSASEERNASIKTNQKRKRYRISKRIDAPNFEVRTLLNGTLQLCIFPFDNDRTKCYRFIKQGGGNSFVCSQCKKQNHCLCACLKKDIYGGEFVQMYDDHICEPVKYYGTIITKIPNNFEEYSNEHGRELYVFNGDGQTTFYYFYWYEKSKCYVCSECVKNGKSTSALVKTDENGEKYVSAESVHACQARQYISKIMAPNFLIRQSRRNPELVVFVDGQRDLCYRYRWSKSQRNFICCKCAILKKTVTASIWKLPTDEEFVQMYKPHICQHIPVVNGIVGGSRKKQRINRPKSAVI